MRPIARCLALALLAFPLHGMPTASAGSSLEAMARAVEAAAGSGSLATAIDRPSTQRMPGSAH